MIFVNQVYGFFDVDQDSCILLDDKNDPVISYAIRILVVTEEKVAVIKIKKEECNMPYWLDTDDLVNMIEMTDACIIKEPYILPASDNGISQKAIERRDKIAPIIKGYWKEKQNDLLDKTRRNKLFHLIAKDYDLGFNKVRRSFYRFWERGMVDNSLLDQYCSCGMPGVDKCDLENSEKIGRKVKSRLGIEQSQGIRITAKDRVKIKKAIRRFYNNKQCKSLMEAYILMWFFYYSTKFYDKKTHKIIGRKRLPLCEIPNYKQFLYWYHKDRDIKAELIAREGYKKYMRDYRPLNGTVMSGIIGPGSQYQIDSTIADVYVKLEHGDLPFGRPVVYGMTDVFSRLIVSIHVSVNHASWAEASSCLLNMVEDKVEFCKKYGIDINERMWPSHHLPSVIITDRGSEFISDKSINFTKNTGVELKHTPPFRPEMKSIVEQNFQIYNGPITSFLPGAVNKNYGERGEERPELSATMTLKEFTRILIGLVLAHNNSSVRRKYGAKEVRIVPVEHWEKGIREHSGSLREPNDISLYKLSLMQTEKGQVNRTGFVWNGLLYDHYKIEQQGKSLEFCYDPRDMSAIYFPNKEWTGYEVSYLKGDSRKYLGWSLSEILFDFQRINDENKLMELKDLEIRAQSVEFLLNEIDNSKKQEEQYDRPLTKAKILNGKRVRRRIASIEFNKTAAIRLQETNDTVQAAENKTYDEKTKLDNKINASIQQRLKVAENLRKEKAGAKG